MQYGEFKKRLKIIQTKYPKAVLPKPYYKQGLNDSAEVYITQSWLDEFEKNAKQAHEAMTNKTPQTKTRPCGSCGK